MYQYLKTVTTCGAAIVLGLGLSAAPADAVPISYNSRVAFEAAAGPLAGFEDFEDLNAIMAGAAGPWNSDTDNPIVDPGDIAEGVAFDASAGGLVTGGPPDFSSIMIGANSLWEELDVIFDAGVNAVGLDIFHANGGLMSNITVSLFDMDDALILATQILVGSAATGGTFFGVIDDMASIGRVRVAATSGAGFELIDNVAFGSFGVTSVPTPGSLALLGLGLAGLGLARRRKAA